MSIMSWNTRGLNNPQRWVDLTHFKNVHKLSVCGLLETRINIANMPNIKHKWGSEWEQLDNCKYFYKCRILILINSKYWN